MKIMSALILPALLMAAASCTGPRNDYSDFTPLPADGWLYGDTIVFTPEITDSIADGELSVAVCHDSDYPYSNLWLEVSFPAGAGSIHRDTIEMQLADPYGHWLGKGLGTGHQMQRTLPGRIRLHRGTRVSVRHIMRLDTLRHIRQVGITFQ